MRGRTKSILNPTASFYALRVKSKGSKYFYRKKKKNHFKDQGSDTWNEGVYLEEVYFSTIYYT